MVKYYKSEKKRIVPSKRKYQKEIPTEKFGLNTAYMVAKIFLNCGMIEEKDLKQTINDLIDGNLKLGVPV